MPLDATTIGKRTPEWEEQLKRIALPRALMSGTTAMRAARERYLPRKVEESNEEYDERLGRAVLLNEFKRTVSYVSGQVFQKPVKYQETAEGEAAAYNEAFFEQFQENVDAQGTNLSMFTANVFREGVVDGVVFVLAEYPQIELQKDAGGRTLYKDATGEWRPRTAKADAENGWNPYLVMVKAEQVLDAWLDVTNGRAVLRSFRYLEEVKRENDDGERVDVSRVRALYPDRWEVWEAVDKGEYVLVSSGPNTLGIVPVSWFMPGEQCGGLSAHPALDDLAEMNLAHWKAYSDHQVLMMFGRSPVWHGHRLYFINEKSEQVAPIFGPGRFFTSSEDGADLRSVGVDPASIEKSFQDLRAMEEYMGLYGLQLVTQQTTGGITATQASIAAASSDSTAKGWVQKLQDCMENVLRHVALWQGEADGPALYINDEFRLPYDAASVQQEASQVRDGLSPLFVLYEMKKKMGVVSEDMTFERYVALIEEDRKRNEAQEVRNTPPFENFGGGDSASTAQ